MPESQGNPESGSDANDGWDAESSGSVNETSQDFEEAGEDSSAGTEITEEETGEVGIEEEGQEQGLETEGEELEPEEEFDENTPFHKHPRFKKLLAQNKQLAESMNTMKQQLEQSNRVAQFYQSRINQLTNQQPGRQEPRQQGRPDTATREPAGDLRGQLPQLVVPEGVKGPPVKKSDGTFEGGWADQLEMSSYFDHRAAQITDHFMEQAYKTTILPTLQKVNRGMAALRGRLVKTVYPDYDEVSKRTWDDLFVLDPAGHVVGNKNPALLQYFQEQDFPELAIYEHGMSKIAPKKSKEAARMATKKTLQQMKQRPKVPTKPLARGGNIAGLPELDWDTPAPVAGKILKKRGLIR